jgi:hypothetical protein
MSKTSILQFDASSEIGHQDATKALREAKLLGNITLGPHIQEHNIVQVTTDDNSKPILSTLQPILGTPITTFTVPFSVLSNAGPATFPVVEYVQNFFPVSKLTPDFQSQIENDFLKFFTTLVPGGPAADPGKIVTGWSDEVTHPDIPGEKARCWTVCRGWETMEGFLKGLETEEFKRAIPILYAWGAPYKMVSLT